MKITLFSEYFNYKNSRRLGRKINLKAAKNFSDEKLESILRELKISYTKRKARYPRTFYEETTMYEIESEIRKSSLLKIIERRLS